MTTSLRSARRARALPAQPAKPAGSHPTARLAALAGRPRRAGYTLIEVMMAVALSVIGVAGISFMQSASVRSNQDAYESMVAANFARTWLERVKRDAILWDTAGNPITGLMFALRANAGASYFVPNGLWGAPRGLVRPAGQPQESSGANYHGVEIGSPSDPLVPGSLQVTNGDTYYCTHLRFTTVQTDNGAAVGMGVDARVYWARKGSLEATQYTGMEPARGNGCDDPSAIYNDAQMQAATACQLRGTENYCLRVHYLRTVVRMVPP